MTIDRRQFIQAGTGTLAGLALWGCQGAAPEAPAIVFRNGVVLPVDDQFSQHSALAIRGNQIIAVGSNDAVMAAAGANPTIVELNGRRHDHVVATNRYDLIAANGQR